MKHNLTNIIEQARDRIAMHDEASRLQQDYENREMPLEYCYRRIQAWKKWYCKRNCRYKVSILVRIESHLIGGTWYYKHFMQLFRNEKLEEKFFIRPEAHDVLTREIISEVRPPLETFILFTFMPQEKKK